MGYSKISKFLILGAKFAEKSTILYNQTKTYLNKNQFQNMRNRWKEVIKVNGGTFEGEFKL